MIRYVDNENKLISSICVAALSIAKSGVLNGRNATTYNFEGSVRRKQLQDFGAILNDERIIQDGNIIKSSSPETALDVAFMTLEQLTSTENMLNIKKRMGFKTI